MLEKTSEKCINETLREIRLSILSNILRQWQLKEKTIYDPCRDKLKQSTSKIQLDFLSLIELLILGYILFTFQHNF